MVSVFAGLNRIKEVGMLPLNLLCKPTISLGLSLVLFVVLSSSFMSFNVWCSVSLLYIILFRHSQLCFAAVAVWM